MLRTASYPRQFGEGEHGVFAGGIAPTTLVLLLKQRTKAISGKDFPSSIPSPLTGEGEGGGERTCRARGDAPRLSPHPNLPPPGGKENTGDMHCEKSPQPGILHFLATLVSFPHVTRPPTVDSLRRHGVD